MPLKVGFHILEDKDYTDKHWRRAVSEGYDVTFENGYGASVIRLRGSSEFELAVVHDGELCYNNPIANGDVVECLDKDTLLKQALNDTLDLIAQLPRNDHCIHSVLYAHRNGLECD